ncbi:glycosyltransferase [Paenibacillus sp. IB182496]|uniref:Glycosyltransferase n=1 Tax=Paenibacillus sabuli TaxID=2772509 RepID=A0A927BTD2_9BACL|nr:glycosyltransferase [Paenibacillus sabuli]MBD2846431.1 glycosyltransferase [Paenibacillus sabuli]
MEEKVSVLIPFYNDPYVGEAIASAVAQTWSNKEIIVIDDGSEHALDKLDPWRGSVHVVQKPNGGTASALNAGLAVATGAYVAWLSSDDRFHPAKLQNQVRFMQACGASISFTDYSIINVDGEQLHSTATPRFHSQAHLHEFLLEGNPVNGCTVVCRRELFDRIGAFDTQLPYTHDYDMWLRALISGYALHYLHEPLTAYRHHPGMGSIRHRADAELETKATMARHRTRLLLRLGA